VLAGVEAGRDDIGVGPEGRGGDDRLDVFLLEHLLEFDIVRRGRLSLLLQDLVSRRE
jgi:hypothetical protein